MAKLSPEQRVANKAASQERSKAFRARREAYAAAMSAAQATATQLPEHTAMVAAQEAFELALVQRNDAISDIDKEIARLQTKREEVRNAHGLVIDAAKARRDLTFDASADASRVLTDAVKASYADMAGVYYVSQWQRPDGV